MNEKRTVMAACEYSIESLKYIKKMLLDIGSPKQKAAWAVGGIIATLTANLLRICQDVIDEAAHSEKPSAVDDIKKIQERFTQFIDKMIGDNENT